MFGEFFKKDDEEQQERQQQVNKSEPLWEYSRCNGRKKAVLVGINYIGKDNELSGCINDVRNIHRFLRNHWGYEEENIVVLTDDNSNQQYIPTRENIISASRWLVQDAAADDALFFHFSGHGTHAKDTEGDEYDGRDEAICPLDYKTAGVLMDDDLHAILVKPLPIGCRLTVVFDSCHSGSALDLPYMYSTEGKIKEPNRLLDARKNIMSAVQSYSAGDYGGVFRSAKDLFSASGQDDAAHEVTKATRSSEADVIFLSGCKDEQTSADAVEGGQATGAMSYALISVLTENPQISYQDLLVKVREILGLNYSQKPQLSSSHPIDTDLLFVC